jgi:hypothetical protein
MNWQLLKFLSGNGIDAHGRKILDIVGWDDERLELVHNYIQWVFPLDVDSKAHPGSPILNADDLEYIKMHDTLTIRPYMLLMLARMRVFYRNGQWLTPNNHNFLRITRIIKSLKLVGLDKEANEFFTEFLVPIYDENFDVIGDTTFKFWKNANEGV